MILRLASHLGEKSRVISPGFKTTKPQKANPDQKSKEKEMGKIQGVTNLPPLKKSRPRDLVAQGLTLNTPTWGNRFQLGFPFCLCSILPYHPTNFVLCSRWIHSVWLESFYVCWHIGVWWIILSELRALLASPRVVPHGRVVMKSNTDDRSLSCEQILSMDTKSFTHCIRWLQMNMCPPGSKQYCVSYRSPGGIWLLAQFAESSGVSALS